MQIDAMNTDPQMQAIVYAIAKCRAENKVILGYLIGVIAENYPGFSTFLKKKITNEIALETDMQLQQLSSVLDLYDTQESATDNRGNSIDKLLKLLSGK